MKKYLLLIVVAFAASVLGAEAVRWARADRSAVSLDSALESEWLSRKLSLDAGQSSAIRNLQADYVAKLKAACADHCAACCKLCDVIFSDGATNDPAAELVGAMSKARADSEMATIAHIREICRILTPGQKKEFEKLVARCVESAGSTDLCRSGKPEGCKTCATPTDK